MTSTHENNIVGMQSAKKIFCYKRMPFASLIKTINFQNDESKLVKWSNSLEAIQAGKMTEFEIKPLWQSKRL